MKETLKDQRSIMLSLTKGLLTDVFVHHQIPQRDLNLDLSKIISRTQSEGLSFFTKTLPTLAKSLDSALLEGFLKPNTSFKTSKRSKLPLMFNGLFKKVFDEDGVLLAEPDICAVKDLRQIGYLFYKYQLPYKPKLVEGLYSDFVATDKDIQTRLNSVEQMSTIFYAKEVINAIFKDYSMDDIRPKNGPGSVANGVPQWGRYKPYSFYPSLDSLVPYSSMFYYNDRHLFDQFDRYFDLDWESHGIAKALAVPKDSRGPRLISSEPSEFMTYQQALKNALVPYLERNRYTSGRVNFTRQDINGSLALEASRNGSYATLDLEKASDLVSLCLVDLLFEDTVLHDFLMKSRSSKTRLPDGRTVSLNKFAPMGSALCFPVEAITFFAVIVGARLANQVPLNEAVKDVYVYGDDIIVPIGDTQMAIDSLTSVGLRVNHSKSCFTGKFRESCGVDAYDGVDVTPTKLKKTWQEAPDAANITSWVAVANNLFANGYWKASDVIRRNLERVVGFLPLCTKDSPIVGWHTWTHKHALAANLPFMKWSTDLQCLRMRAKIVISKTLRKLHDGWCRMLRFAWYHPLNEYDLFDGEPMDTAAFSLRYQALQKNKWVTESDL